MADPTPVKAGPAGDERQRVRLAALVFAGLAAIMFVVLLVLGLYIPAIGAAAVAVGAGILARSMYEQLHAEALQLQAQQRAMGRIVDPFPEGDR